MKYALWFIFTLGILVSNASSQVRDSLILNKIPGGIIKLADQIDADKKSGMSDYDIANKYSSNGLAIDQLLRILLTVETKNNRTQAYIRSMGCTIVDEQTQSTWVPYNKIYDVAALPGVIRIIYGARTHTRGQ